VITYDELPSILVEWFPSSEESVNALVRDMPGEGGVLTFIILSECFWWKIFEPALRASDPNMIERCFQATERLLVEGDSVVQDALSVRVLEWLLDPAWKEFVLLYSGPETRRILTDPAV
jgi:hypothetical protein